MLTLSAGPRQAIVLTLEGDHPAELKEQALCILANIADGASSRDFILGNEDVLKKLMNYMVSGGGTRRRPDGRGTGGTRISVPDCVRRGRRNVRKSFSFFIHFYWFLGCPSPHITIWKTFLC